VGPAIAGVVDTRAADARAETATVRGAVESCKASSRDEGLGGGGDDDDDDRGNRAYELSLSITG
jgi:hypothetical protein